MNPACLSGWAAPPRGTFVAPRMWNIKKGTHKRGGTFSCFLVPPQTRLPPFLLGTKSDVISFFLPSASAANKRGGGGPFTASGASAAASNAFKPTWLESWRRDGGRVGASGSGALPWS